MPEFTYEQIHEERYRISEEWLSTLSAGNVLEVGAPDGFSSKLKTLYPNVENTNFDLRFPRHWPSVAGRFDLVVAMEIIEHINEPIRSASTIDELSKFDGVGLQNVITGCFEALKPGGNLFLTTPNGASVENIRRALNGYMPIQYYPHVREYGPNNIVELLEKTGFTIKRIEFPSCYLKFCTQAELEERAAIRALMRHRWPSILRGETVFIIANKS